MQVAEEVFDPEAGIGIESPQADLAEATSTDAILAKDSLSPGGNRLPRMKRSGQPLQTWKDPYNDIPPPAPQPGLGPKLERLRARVSPRLQQWTSAAAAKLGGKASALWRGTVRVWNARTTRVGHSD